jgi:RIO-like serine/threonine protein kinase|tara:strand:- start:4211 stop:4669 length:459 start_codon:yes stop_codon:yes gene_type:complete
MSKITLLQNYDSPILLENHSEGWVYKISDEYVAKVEAPGEFPSYNIDMFYEIKMARLLYSFGISVPEPIICDYVKVDNEVKRGFIMEFINGKSIHHEMNTNDRSLAEHLLKIELEKCYKRGFTIKDDFVEWILTKNKTIKLIDFTTWKYKGL